MVNFIPRRLSTIADISSDKWVLTLMVLLTVVLGVPAFHSASAGDIHSELLKKAKVAETLDVIVYLKNQPLPAVAKRIKSQRSPEIKALSGRIKKSLKPYLPKKVIRDKNTEARMIKRALRDLPLDVKDEIRAIRKVVDDRHARVDTDDRGHLREMLTIFAHHAGGRDLGARLGVDLR